MNQKKGGRIDAAAASKGLVTFRTSPIASIFPLASNASRLFYPPQTHSRIAFAYYSRGAHALVYHCLDFRYTSHIPSFYKCLSFLAFFLFFTIGNESVPSVLRYPFIRFAGGKKKIIVAVFTLFIAFLIKTAKFIAV